MELARNSAPGAGLGVLLGVRQYSTTCGDLIRPRGDVAGKVVAGAGKVAGKFDNARRVVSAARIAGHGDGPRIVRCRDTPQRYEPFTSALWGTNTAIGRHHATSPHRAASRDMPTRYVPACLRDVATCDWLRRQLPREKPRNRCSSGEVGVLPLRRIRPERTKPLRGGLFEPMSFLASGRFSSAPGFSDSCFSDSPHLRMTKLRARRCKMSV